MTEQNPSEKLDEAMAWADALAKDHIWTQPEGWGVVLAAKVRELEARLAEAENGIARAVVETRKILIGRVQTAEAKVNELESALERELGDRRACDALLDSEQMVCKDYLARMARAEAERDKLMQERAWSQKHHQELCPFVAERDRLKAENAELRKRLEEGR